MYQSLIQYRRLEHSTSFLEGLFNVLFFLWSLTLHIPRNGKIGWMNNHILFSMHNFLHYQIIYTSGSQTLARQACQSGPRDSICCLFLFLIICMWQYETCLNLITFCVIKKVSNKLHQSLKSIYNPRAGPRPLGTSRFALVMSASRTYSAPLQKQFWPFQVALESHPALLRKCLRTPDLYHGFINTILCYWAIWG